jgi:hypothetical protein
MLEPQFFRNQKAHCLHGGFSISLQRISFLIMTQKEAFLHYFEAMDFEMLGQIIPDDCNCFGVSRERFLKRLHRCFGLGADKNASLFKIRKIKYNRNLYLLSSKRHYFSLRFLIILDKHQNIKKLKSYRTSFDLLRIVSLSFNDLCFQVYQKSDIFYKNKDSHNYEKAKLAYDEIKLAEKQVLTSKKIGVWIKKYRTLYLYTVRHSQSRKFKNFRNEYFGYLFLYGQLSHAKEANQAIEEYYSHSYEHISDWFEKYYRLGFCKVHQFSDFYNDVDYSINFVKSIEDIYYRGEDFIVIHNFSVLINYVLVTYGGKR